MRRPALLALAATILLPLATASSAHADGTYVSAGLGPGEVSDDLGAHVRDTIAGRFAIGHRVGNIAVEGYVGPESDNGDTTEPGLADFTAVRLGIDVRYILPVGKNLQLYARGGLSRMSASLPSPEPDDFSSADDYSGRGLGGGVGVQLRGKVRGLGFLYWPLFFIPVGPKVDAALFVDHGVDFYRLHREVGPAHSIDARFTRLTIGVNVGADF